jgi:N-acetylneuraminic acid mutarotase
MMMRPAKLSGVLVFGIGTGAMAACAPSEAELMAEVTTDTRAGVSNWTNAAPLPQGRTEVSVTSDGSRIYLAGGFAEATDLAERASAPREMWIYDPSTDAWTSGSDIPEGLNHAGFVHLDGRLYLVGGFRETTFEPIADVRVYDIGTGTWSDGSPMPTARGAMAVTVLDGRIHAIGGNVAGREAVHDHDGSRITTDNSVAIHEAFDPGSGLWERLAPMPTPRNHIGAAVLNGRIHVVGGRAEGNFELNAHEVYDPVAERWETAAAVPTGRSGVAVVEGAGLLYIFGGETFGFSPRTFDAAERYDPSSDRWERLPPMPTARHGLGAATVGEWVHVISGGPGPGFTYGTYHERFGPIAESAGAFPEP